VESLTVPKAKKEQVKKVTKMVKASLQEKLAINLPTLVLPLLQLPQQLPLPILLQLQLKILHRMVKIQLLLLQGSQLDSRMQQSLRNLITFLKVGKMPDQVQSRLLD